MIHMISGNRQAKIRHCSFACCSLRRAFDSYKLLSCRLYSKGLCGHIPSESIARWNRGELPVALIHPASAGHGLNLQSGGSTIIWFGLTWSLELYLQTNARLWRQGQNSETVVLHHIIAKDTIDKRIMKALSENDKTQAALIDAVKANL